MVISDILLFVRIAETLSFKEAAQHLGMSRAQVSKRIAALEKAVGARLIYRSPRSISLTAAGELLLGYYRHIFDTMEEAKVAVENLRSTCSGRLRFSMPTCIGATLLPRLYCEFMPRHPHLLLEAHTSESCVDIVAGGYDVAIRMAQRLDDSTLTARRLATSSLVLAAAPAYLQERGSPGHPAELTRHRCLGLHRETSRPGMDFRRRGQAPRGAGELLGSLRHAPRARRRGQRRPRPDLRTDGDDRERIATG
jgi:DNA-binding transcriptional LysR family regulator